jgi:hypothetical protein
MTAALATKPVPQTAAAKQDHAHDFDFLHGGKWNIHNKRLKLRLQGCTEWDEFSATASARPILNGFGNEEEFRTDFWPHFAGMAFRFYNPITETWAIYWADSRGIGVLEPPVKGRIEGDRGIFVGEDFLNGRPIIVHYIWSRVNTASPRWEQAFSGDGGKTWETNWIMDFTRAE